LGVACSLRNARWGKGSDALLSALRGLTDTEALLAWLKEESELHLQHFVTAGRAEGKDFLTIYENLQRLTGERGLSNSETALAAGLWAADQHGVEIDHVSLSEHFGLNGRPHRQTLLREKLLAADGLLISGPVYFGDRGSLAESLIELVERDPELRAHLQGRVYGGIAVGAKRNGGQETNLIYQMMDMLRLGLLAVGNDSDTTAQYGGTGHAGDVGTMHRDRYGLDTAMGTGRRLARVLRLLDTEAHLRGPVRVLVPVLAEAGGRAERLVRDLVERHSERVRATVLVLDDAAIRRCIACDICPTHIDVDDSYRCIIQNRKDPIRALHTELLGHDLVMPVVAVARDRNEVRSRYQLFMERTRYLRRGDYVFSDQLVSPLVVEELGAQSTYLMRMTTSFVRHHTVVSRPHTAYVAGGELLDAPALEAWFTETLSRAQRLAAGRLDLNRADHEATRYNPVGYVLAADKEAEDRRLERREAMQADRRERIAAEAEARLVPGA